MEESESSTVIVAGLDTEEEEAVEAELSRLAVLVEACC